MNRANLESVKTFKTFGALTVYRRKNKPCGVQRYVVGHSDGRLLREFHNVMSALKWAEKNHKWYIGYYRR